MPRKGVLPMNRREFAQSCAEETGLSQVQVNKVLDYFIEHTKTDLMAGNAAAIPGIGKIVPVERKINPHTDPVTNSYHDRNVYKTIRMKVSPSFKEMLNAY